MLLGEDVGVWINCSDGNEVDASVSIPEELSKLATVEYRVLFPVKAREPSGLPETLSRLMTAAPPTLITCPLVVLVA